MNVLQKVLSTNKYHDVSSFIKSKEEIIKYLNDLEIELKSNKITKSSVEYNLNNILNKNYAYTFDISKLSDTANWTRDTNSIYLDNYHSHRITGVDLSSQYIRPGTLEIDSDLISTATINVTDHVRNLVARELGVVNLDSAITSSTRTDRTSNR